MKRNKFLDDIRNKIEFAYAYYCENSDDPSIFFDENCNLFLSNNKESFKYLKNQITNNFGKLKSFDNLETKMNKYQYFLNYKTEAENRLKYFLFCAYAYELRTKRNIFEYKPPFKDDIVKFILNHREENYEFYKKLFKAETDVEVVKNKKKLNKSIYINDNTLIKNLLNKEFGNSIRSNEDFLIDEKVQNDLIFKVRKYPLFESDANQESSTAYYNSKYYIGWYNQKPVLFVVGSRRLKSSKDGKISMSYQLSVALNGEIEKNRLLYRMDYNVGSNHINKLNAEGKINITQTDENIDKLRFENIKKCHVHMPTEKYSILFPNFLRSCEAIDMEYVCENLEQFVNDNKSVSNVSDGRAILTEDDRKAMLRSKDVNSFKFSKFLGSKTF